MRLPPRSAILSLLLCFSLVSPSFPSAYNARPKLVVVIIIDQLRGDYLDRYRDQFGEGGFRLFLDHGANFTDCNYNYANTVTGSGHATLLTGAYSNGHGIMGNEMWDPQRKQMVATVRDDSTKLVGIPGNAAGVSPHNLLADTLGDELKLATKGTSRVFGLSMKDRAAILPAGFSGDGAYWIDSKTGNWITSTYYRSDLPKWTQDFNDARRVEKYYGVEWKDSNGNVLRSTKAAPGKSSDFYRQIGATPFANDYEFDFARELIAREKLGNGPTTDLLVISLSANDILGHEVGPDAPEMQAMLLATDRQLAGFFDFLGQQIGLANVWIALSADHGIAPLPSVAAKLHIPAAGINGGELQAKLNSELAAKLSPGHPAKYVQDFSYTVAWLNEDAFAAIKMKEEDAERAVGEAMKEIGLRDYYTRSQLARGAVPNTPLGTKYLNSYSPLGGWYVLTVQPPFTFAGQAGTTHGSPYTYDTHVPLAVYGLPFQPGNYRTHSEPVDLAATLASLLGINAPTHSVGRVLTEALAPSPRAKNVNAKPIDRERRDSSFGALAMSAAEGLR